MTDTETRWDYNPWYLTSHLGEPPRRENMFLEPSYVMDVWRTALATERPIYMTWMVIEYDEERRRDFPSQRRMSGLAVMDIVEPDSKSLPTGWAYLLAPSSIAAIRASADVVTDIGIEL